MVVCTFLHSKHEERVGYLVHRSDCKYSHFSRKVLQTPQKSAQMRCFTAQSVQSVCQCNHLILNLQTFCKKVLFLFIHVLPAYDYLFRLILFSVFSHQQLTSKTPQIFVSILTQTPIYLSRTKALELQKVRTFAKTTILSNRYFPNNLPETTMAEWFECKIKYERTMDNGLVKKVNEPYLVDALNFTEAERRIIKEVAPFMSGEFQVSDIKRARFAEIFETSDDAADRWYKAKLSFITLDEKSGKEKKTSHNMLVQAGDLRDAVKRLDEGMKGSMMDYEIAAVSETSIMDVFHYKADDVPEKGEE